MRTRAGLLLTIALPAALSAQWKSQVSKDEMTNEVQAYCRFSLKGASDAIAQARASCKK